MAISIQCDRCHRRYQVIDAVAGKSVRCKECGHVFVGRDEPQPQPVAVDPYAMEEEEAPAAPMSRLTAPTVAGKTKPKRRTPASGLPLLSRLPVRGLWVYYGLILAAWLGSLLVRGEPKLVLALVGVVLSIGPFLALAFTARYGIAFRDGLIPGLLYMVFLPYRIHYRFTHQELFRQLSGPQLKVQDWALILVALLFLPVLSDAAHDIDKPTKLAVKQPWERLGDQAARAAQKAVMPPAPMFRPGQISPPLIPPRQAPVEPGEVAVGGRAGSPAADSPPTRSALEDRIAQGGPWRPSRDLPWPPRPEFTPPVASPVATRPNPTPAPTFGLAETVTITVRDVPDSATAQRVKEAIEAVLKSSEPGWSIQWNSTGTTSRYTVAPIRDPQAFADRIEFGTVRRVDGRLIEVDARP